MEDDLVLLTYESAARVLKSFFGPGWVEQQLASPGRSRAAHRVPQLVAAAEADVHEAEQVLGAYRLLFRSAEMFELSNALVLASRCPYFDKEITPELLRGPDGERHLHAVRVAAAAIMDGYDVAFIPRSAHQTADLQLSRQTTHIHAECKPKDRYLVRDTSTSWAVELTDAVAALRPTSELDYDVHVSVIGHLDESRIGSVVAEIRSLISTGAQGVSLLRHGVLVHVKGRPVDPSRGGMPTTLQQDSFALAAETAFHCEPEGTVSHSSRVTCSTFVLRATSIKSILDSFEKAAQPIPPGVMGLICIEVDTAGLRGRDVTPYLEMMARCIVMEFTPQRNTRIAAVLLTTDHIAKLQVNAANGGVLPVRSALAVFNPYETRKFKVPGWSE
ncbi:MAG TPA: hypothetical protein VK939_06605 [Longimicrobiales bacterium]|nr:hypothetical protein [Longimicrobiales bacterium]